MALLKVPAYLDRNIDKAFVFNELIIFSYGGIYIFVSTNCMHYDDSEWFNEFDQCVLKQTNRDELYNKKLNRWSL